MAGEQNFDSIKNNGYTNELTYRGPKKRSGVSFDYMDKLNEFIEQGIFYDADGKGFTKEEKLALEDEFMRIHKEKGYDTNFRTMQAGKKFEYTYEEFVSLAKAAGYLLKEAPSEEVKEQIEEQEIEVTDKEVVTTDDTSTPEAVTEVTEVEDTPETADVPEGNERISNNGKDKANDAVSDLPDGEVDIDFEGTEIVNTQTGEVVKSDMTVTVNDTTPKKTDDSPELYKSPGGAVIAENAKKEADALLNDPDFSSMSRTEQLNELAAMMDGYYDEETGQRVKGLEQELHEAWNALQEKRTVDKKFLGIKVGTKQVALSDDEMAQRRQRYDEILMQHQAVCIARHEIESRFR